MREYRGECRESVAQGISRLNWGLFNWSNSPSNYTPITWRLTNSEGLRTAIPMVFAQHSDGRSLSVDDVDWFVNRTVQFFR